MAALEILTREFAQRSEVAVDGDFEHVDLSPAAQLTVYRLVQEALTNVAKYAKATQVDVSLGRLDEQHVRIAVHDNGVGFDSEVERTASHGLIGMRYRVEADGGSMRLVSSPGQGTLIEAILPASDIDSPAASDAPPEAVPA